MDFYFQDHPLEEECDFYFCGEVYIFYSFQDLGFGFGWNNVERELLKEIRSKSRHKIEQRRSITGTLKIEDPYTCRLNNWKISDLCCWTNTSLKEFASSLGISMESKGLLDNYKTQMDVALLSHTKTFLDYGLDDVLVLKEIHKRFITFVNDVLSKTLNFPSKSLFTQETIPYTTGALVSETFERFIYNNAQRDSQCLYYNYVKGVDKENIPSWTLGANSAFYTGSWSISLLKQNHSKREEYLSVYQDLFSSGKLEDVLAKTLEYSENLRKWAYSSPFESLPYSGASIQTLSLGDLRTTSLLNCLVSGGRANNELPSEYKVDYVFDVDLQSCYGSALASLEYPIGLPTIIAFGPNETKMSLRDFLKELGQELIPGLYKITVSGKLTFEQDLLFSKVTSYEKMRETVANFNKKMESEDVDVVHFANDFVLTRRECLNVILTSDILEVLENVCTSQEYSEILGLQVETAIFWKKSNRCKNTREWIRGVLENPGELVYHEKTQSASDSRSRLWYSVPLKDFTGRLVEQRNSIKKESKLVEDLGEKRRLSGLQQILKLFVNTLYGCLASPYFSIGNVVLADNITAKARVNVWMLCKSLNLRQCITDGGIYSPLTNGGIYTPTQVNSFKENKFRKKPGLHSFSDIRRLQKHKSISVGSLKNKDWPTLFEERTVFRLVKNLDEGIGVLDLYKNLKIYKKMNIW